jgi:hypothetical protein
LKNRNIEVKERESRSRTVTEMEKWGSRSGGEIRVKGKRRRRIKKEGKE